MSSYNTAVYTEQGGSRIVVGAGGSIDILSGGSILAAGTQAAHIADAVVAHDVNSTFSDTEVEAALNALGVKINAVIAVLEGAGLTATS